jgi:hypothetical protein
MQIVLARLDEAQALVKRGRVDLGERNEFHSTYVPVAMMWTNNGTDADIAKAQRFAATEGYTVLCYTAEKDPLNKARADISK